MVFEGIEYSLSNYRKWLTINHQELCLGNFIKSLTILGKTKKYFDWQTIYHISFEYQFINNYIHEQLATATSQS